MHRTAPSTDSPAVEATGGVQRRPGEPGRAELTAMLAMSMALAALGIDLMLPAFGAIRSELGLAADSNAVAGLVTAYFLGLALGQLVYGPIADRYGRRRTLYIGFAIYGIGAALATFAPSLGLLLLSRAVWGFGAAGARVVTFAVVRDRTEGDVMARTMSFIMAVFILVPIVAPTLGAAVVAVASWRWVFGVCVVAVGGMALWARRLPETLAEHHRRELRLRPVARAAREVVSHRATVGYTLAMTSLYAIFVSWIGSSEIIVSEVFDARDAFPLVFGGLAAAIGVAILLNARLVERVGTRRLAHLVLFGYVGASLLLVAVAFVGDGTPPLWLFLGVAALLLGSHGLLIPNLNTIAMQPMGAVAGTASSVIGAVQLAGGALLGAVVDRAFDGTVRPLALGFLGFGVLALLLVLWAERGRLFEPLRAPA
ncbi:MAG: multidrug effflux MFS transporter [Actinomycetes bacterium]